MTSSFVGASLAQLEGLPFPVDISFVKIRLIFSQLDNSSVKCLLPLWNNLVYLHDSGGSHFIFNYSVYLLLTNKLLWYNSKLLRFELFNDEFNYGSRFLFLINLSITNLHISSSTFFRILAKYIVAMNDDRWVFKSHQ